jgi:hypothetical protein
MLGGKPTECGRYKDAKPLKVWNLKTIDERNKNDAVDTTNEGEFGRF